jgi:cbb3-type cytochrome oxidase subunit 3
MFRAEHALYLIPFFFIPVVVWAWRKRRRAA